MKRYKNKSRISGVVAYETGTDFIKVKFTGSDDVYKYSYRSTGKPHVESMKDLAESGRGLSTYISQYVKDRFEK
ncbi:MAG TPA: hypothetical protein VK623_05735 [Flavobacterium sp.]|nr:hypothetical protein [Flavobacterium sp.]